MYLKIWQYRLWSFQGRDTKLERFLAKNQLKSNEIGVVANCQKIDFEFLIARHYSNSPNLVISYLTTVDF